jgi:tetratricopeptide (TPR) repeat protein
VQAALEIAKTKHYTNGMAECLLLKCELELQAQCFPQVIEIAHEALETLKAIDASYLSAFHRLMGLAYWKQGDFKSAVVHGQQALSLATASKDKKAKLLAHQNLAHIYIYLDDYDEALSHLHLALSLAQELGAQEQLAIVHNYIGLIHWNQGKDELAMSEFEASIKIAETFDFQRHLHTALHNLGNVYARRGELHSNPDDLQKALCFFETTRLLHSQRKLAQNTHALMCSSISVFSTSKKKTSRLHIFTLTRHLHFPNRFNPIRKSSTFLMP